MYLNTWLPATLRSAGIKVVETSGWTSRTHGALPAKIKVVWHHDASPPGDSPGALNWMISNWNNASAQVWIDRYGTWHLVGIGVAWHAGSVKAGMPDNYSSIGIETDHTTGETWPKAQLDSLRAGTAAIFKKQQVGSDWLQFHKVICSPSGRKSDPDGLELLNERSAVGKLMSGTTPPPVTPPKPPIGDTDLPLNAEDKKWIQDAIKGQLNIYFASGEGNPATGRIVQASKTAMQERLAFWLPRTLNVLVDGKGNQAYAAGSTIALDNKGDAQRVWDIVMPPNADGGNPEKAQPGRKARDSIAALLSLAHRTFNKV